MLHIVLTLLGENERTLRQRALRSRSPYSAITTNFSASITGSSTKSGRSNLTVIWVSGVSDYSMRTVLAMSADQAREYGASHPHHCEHHSATPTSL